MRKLLITFLALSGGLFSTFSSEAATITSNPSPAVSNKPLEITISGQDLGSEVYCYTWCDKIGSESKSPFKWNEIHTSQFRMTCNGNSYTFSISDIKAFYGLTDPQLENLTKLGFIAKTASGKQTDNLFVDVVQGRRDAYSGGEGTSSNPFILKTSSDLQTLASTPGDWAEGVYLRMEADVDASGLSACIGSASTPFSAVFDGNGHCVRNLTLSCTTIGNPTGLFGYIDGGEVRNLGIISADVSGTNDVGILAGELRKGKIEKCFTSGTVKGTSICVGGLVGENVTGQIHDCYSGATVENPSDYATGGLVGKNRGVITNTYSAGAVSGFDYVGGLVGANYGTIKNSVALNSSITSYYDFSARFGGNNNSENNVEQTYSWADIEPGHNIWTSHGDHAAMHPSITFRNRSQFQSLTGWDFNTVWDWRGEGGREYPVLRNLSNQSPLFSDAYFSNTTSVMSVVSEGGEMLRVGPNPTPGELRIVSSTGISLYELYSVNGGLMMRGESSGVNEITLDLGGMAGGLYILRTISADGSESVNKVIKK